MEFLIIWFLGSDIIDSGLRYENVEECFASARNTGQNMQSVGIMPPKFTCIPLKKHKDFKIYRKNNSSSFPFN